MKIEKKLPQGHHRSTYGRCPSYPVSNFVEGILDYCGNRRITSKKRFSLQGVPHAVYDLKEKVLMRHSDPFYQVWRKSLLRDGRVILKKVDDQYILDIGVLARIKIEKNGRICSINILHPDRQPKNILNKFALYNRLIDEYVVSLGPWRVRDFFA